MNAIVAVPEQFLNGGRKSDVRQGVPERILNVRVGQHREQIWTAWPTGPFVSLEKIVDVYKRDPICQSHVCFGCCHCIRDGAVD
jgi:hypothetical protein